MKKSESQAPITASIQKVTKQEFENETEVKEFNISKLKLWCILGGLLFGTMACATDEIMVATVAGNISEEFPDSEELAAWIPTIYLLSITSFQLVYGRFSDIFGRKNMITFALGSFILGSIGFATFRSMRLLILARFFTAMGSTGLFSMPYVILGDIIPLDQRSGYFGIVGFIYALSNAVGPLIGGIIADKLGWRYIHLVSIPISVIGIILLSFLVPQFIEPTSFTTKLKRVDILGILTLILGITSIVLGFNWAGFDYEWTSYQVLLSIGLGVCLLVVFALIELRVAKEPMLSFHIFNFNVVVTSLVTLLACYPYFTFFYMWPMFLDEVRHLTAFECGVASLPLLVGVCVSSILCGYAIDYTGACRALIRFGMLLILVGIAMLFRLDVEPSHIEEAIYMILIGLGVGINIQATIVVSQAALDESDVAAVSSLSSFVLAMGGVFGFAIHHSVMLNFKDAALLYLEESLPNRTELAATIGFRSSFLTMIPVATLGLILSFMIRPVDLARK